MRKDNEPTEVGYVTGINEFLIKVNGLPGAWLKELVLFEKGAIGQVFTINEDSVDILVIEKMPIVIGEKVTRTNSELYITIPKNPEGHILDALGKFKYEENSTAPLVKIERSLVGAPASIFARKTIQRNFETGVSIVDITCPLGVGQRELILGDRKTGKTQLLFQVIKNQAMKGTFCVYAAIGKKEIEIHELAEQISSPELVKNVCVIGSSITDGVGKIYLTPYTAMTIAEHMRDQGRDVLLILDDLTTHAQYYREISLIARRFPGRASYPGNIFHLHALLMERAGNYKIGQGEVAITCLPVAQSTLGEITSYITTNLMSMTDGHIYLDTEIFDEGRRPAVNPFLSVTRVGHQTQTELMKDVSREVTSFLIEYKRAQDFSHFGSEASDEIKTKLVQGKLIYALFDQKSDVVIPSNVSIFVLAHLWAGSMKGLTPEMMRQLISKNLNAYKDNLPFRNSIHALFEKHKALKTLLVDIHTIPLAK